MAEKKKHQARRYECPSCKTDWEVYETYEDFFSDPADACPECGKKGKLTEVVDIENVKWQTWKKPANLSQILLSQKVSAYLREKS